MKGRRSVISRLTIASFRGFSACFAVLLLSTAETVAKPYRQQPKCSSRLENALEHMRRRSSQVKSSRSIQTPYDIYHSLYGPQNEPENSEPFERFYNYGNYMPSYSYGRRGYYAKNMQQDERYSGDDPLWERNARSKLTISRVDVEDLKVRLPAKPESRWVEIDKCSFSTANATLDTRLIFPDLTISGKVILQPTGGKCHMILRLRHAGIEFHTTPIGFDIAHNDEGSRRSGSATVRTDSHFAEPGFISVFAHGCQGPTGIRTRQNSKRRFGFAVSGEPDIELSEPNIVIGTKLDAINQRWGKRDQFYPNYDIRNGLKIPSTATGSSRFNEKNLEFNDYGAADSREGADDYRPGEDNFYRRQGRHRFKRQLDRMLLSSSVNDEMHFDDDILNLSDENLLDAIKPDARTIAELLNGEEAVNDALTGELEKIFSMGVKGLLTTYMQRALQPAIKETLMENMGYTLSYG